jgi:ribonuclease HI
MKGTVICDGRGNAGTGACGVILTTHSDDSWDTISFEEGFAKQIEPTTNIVAEHLAMQYGMELAKIAGITELRIYNDSQTPVYQLQGHYRTKEEHLKPIVERSWELGAEFESVEVIWTPRENTSRADRLAREIDKRGKTASRPRPGGPLPSPQPRENPFAKLAEKMSVPRRKT